MNGPGAEMDAESEALVRRVHRELNGNGLRGRRGAAVVPEPVKPRNLHTKSESKLKSKREDDNKRALDSPTSHERSEARTGKPGNTSDSADTGSLSDSESVRIPETQPIKKHKKEARKQSKVPSPPAPKSFPASTPPTSIAARLIVDNDVFTSTSKQDAPAGNAQPQTAAAQSHAMQTDAAVPSSQPPPQPQPQFRSSLETAALTSSASVRDKVKQQGSTTVTGGAVKCFYTGIRWGINLQQGALGSRSDLATALNDAFANEILSCGRGDMLSVVFLDGNGHLIEFPSLKGTNNKDSVFKWKAAAEQARKVFVSRS